MKFTKQQIENIVLFGGAFVVLLVILNVTAPYVCKLFPNDYSRIGIVLEALKDRTAVPEIAVFGNSKAMSGVDAKIIQENLSGNLETYNFSSVGQSIGESLLFYPMLPAETKVVVQCFKLEEFTQSLVFNEPAIIALKMGGYPMNNDIKQLLPQTFWSKLDKPDIYYNFRSRQTVSSGLIRFLRLHLDEDAPDSKILDDLKFPYLFPLGIDKAVNYQLVKQMLEEEDYSWADNFSISEDCKSLLIKANDYLKGKNIELYIAIISHAPDIATLPSDKQTRIVGQLQEELPQLKFINCQDVLTSDDFYDPLHPNIKGAEKISVKIADVLNREFCKEDSLKIGFQK